MPCPMDATSSGLNYGNKNLQPCNLQPDDQIKEPTETSAYLSTTHVANIARERQYSCKACLFSTPKLLAFLTHVQKMHFELHASKKVGSEVEVPQDDAKPVYRDAVKIKILHEPIVKKEIANRPNEQGSFEQCAQRTETGNRQFAQYQSAPHHQKEANDGGADRENIIKNSAWTVNKSTKRSRRGVKINSIINSLKEYGVGNARCQRGTDLIEGIRCSNCRSFPESNLAMCACGTNSHASNFIGVPCDQRVHQCTNSSDVDGRKNWIPRNEHFVNIQSLVSSGSVTMPQIQILQSIKCEKLSWQCVQVQLHRTFCNFPYLTMHEAQMLAGTTGLTVQQVKALFVVARLQHGISWDQDEINNARKSLKLPANRFEVV